jgi:hypothetical protein
MSIKKILVLVGILVAVTVIFTACAGPQGETGPAGPAGPAGPQGPQGPAGEAAEVNVTDLTCTECHNDTSIITGKRAAWEESLHGSGAAFIEEGPRNTCAGCHSGATFSAMIASGQNFTEVESGDANPTHQDCRTCHEIHTTYTSADWALETTDPVTLVVSGEIYDGGTGNLCANCHQARRYLADFESQTTAGSYESTSPRFNPHLSVQSDMLLGLPGAGVESAASIHYTGVENTCVGCHMGENDNHLFEPQLAKCQECHADAEDFDINGALTAVDERMAELRTALQSAGLLDAEGEVIPGTYTAEQATALWNYETIVEDASRGVHNPAYVNAMLDAAFAALGQ